MLLVIAGGTALAMRVLRLVRRTTSDANLTRVSAVLAGYFLTSAFFFLFLHGDAEAALKGFALQLGMLILAERLLIERSNAPPDSRSGPEGETVPAFADAGLPPPTMAASRAIP